MQYGPITNGGVRAHGDSAIRYRTIWFTAKYFREVRCASFPSCGFIHSESTYQTENWQILPLCTLYQNRDEKRK